AGAALGGFFGALIGTPILTLIGLFIGAGVYHLLVILLIKPNAGFEGSFRVVAYASVVQLVSWIPILGGLLALYSVVLAIFGMREVHGSSTGRAAAVVLIPTAVLLLIALLFFAALLAVLFSSGSGA
ncbi:MAG: YIP1 family protein, partial [Rubrobacter sp.]